MSAPTVDYPAAITSHFLHADFEGESGVDALAVLTVEGGSIVIWDYFGDHAELAKDAATRLVNKGYLTLRMFSTKGSLGDEVPHYINVFKHSVYSVTTPTIDIIGG